MSTGTASSFFVANAGVDTVKPAARVVFKNPLPPGTDQLAASKAETALMNGRALDTAAAPGSKTRSKVNAPPTIAQTPAPTFRKDFDAAVARAQLPKSQAADLSSSSNPAYQRGLMSTFLKG
jgi:hypothetical protein